MESAQLATRINKRVKKHLEQICKKRGWKINRFVEEALLDKLEELEDLEDLKSLRQESTRPLAEILKDLKADGKI